MALLRSCPEDFRVVELPLADPEGDGPHCWLEVEKRGATTEQVARELARRAGVAPRDVGFAGRKDRYAVTRQWFSVPGTDPQTARAWEVEAITVLRAEGGRRKLRPGDLRGNRFELRLRQIEESSRSGVEGRLETMDRRGFANRFGAQRFGRHGDNPERGAQLLRGGRSRMDRRTARFLVSALQSAVFNRTFEERTIGIDELRSGDLAWEHSSGSVFTVTHARLEEARQRAERFELSPSGPLFGDKMWRPKEETLAEEERALEALGLPSYGELQVPRWLKLPGGRRPFRVPVDGLEWQWQADELELRFTLPPGSYATVLVEELFVDLEEVREGESASKD